MSTHAVDNIVQKILRGDFPQSVGILTTKDFQKETMYTMRFAQHGITFLTPTSTDQKNLAHIISETKSGKKPHLIGPLTALIRNLKNRGAKSVLLATPELSELTPQLEEAGVPLIDPLQITTENSN
jgi:aspartate/glutamate racemase